VKPSDHPMLMMMVIATAAKVMTGMPFMLGLFGFFF